MIANATWTGEILGLIGRLGSGRTELALSLFGMNPPDSGAIRVNGQPVQLRTNREAIRQKIAYVSEDRLSIWQMEFSLTQKR